MSAVSLVRHERWHEAAEPISEIVVPLELDPLKVADDATFFCRIDKQINLPDFAKTGLKALY